MNNNRKSKAEKMAIGGVGCLFVIVGIIILGGVGLFGWGFVQLIQWITSK